MLEYIRKKSSDLLDFQIQGEEGRDGSTSGAEVDVEPEQERHIEASGSGPVQEDDNLATEHGAEDISMAEPLDMDMFLLLAQEIEAENAFSSPVTHSPKRPTLTPLIRLGPERPTPSFDWNARQKDAVQISWETQEPALPQQPEASQHISDADFNELPGETQLCGGDEEIEAESEAPEADHGSGADSGDELPTETQLQGGPVAFDEASTSPAGDAQRPDADEFPPPSLLNGESDALAEAENGQNDGDSSVGDDDFPTETQLHGYAAAFVESVADHVPSPIDEEDEDVFPSETQLNGHSTALAPLQPLETLEEGADPVPSETDVFPDSDQLEGDAEALATQAPGVDGGVSEVDEDQGEGSLAGNMSPEGTQSELPDMDELTGDYAALNVSDQELNTEDVDTPLKQDQPSAPLQDSDTGHTASEPHAEETKISEPSPTGDELEHGELPTGEEYTAAEVAPAVEDGDGDKLPCADQLQGEGGAWSDNDELAVAKHLDDETLGSSPSRQRPRSSPAPPPAQHQAMQQSQRVGLEMAASVAASKATPIASGEGHVSGVAESSEEPLSQSEQLEEAAHHTVEARSGTVQNAVTVEVHQEDLAIATLPTSADPPPAMFTISEAHRALHTSASRPAPRRSLPAMKSKPQHPRRAPNLTDFATPDPEDGPVEHSLSTPGEAAEHLHGPRRVQRLRTDSPTRRSQRFSPPMLLPFVPHHDRSSPRTPETPSLVQARDPGSSLLRSSVMRSATSVRRIDSQTPLGSARQQIVTKVRSEGASSVVPTRRSRSVTGRLGYVAPRNDPYLHDENGGPLEPNPDYVTPDVYPTPPQDRAQRRTSVPLHRKSRRWTEAEALLLYRTIQKAWWSERTAQQVAWYLHGEWGQMSQKLKAFTVQNMKDKMREIVKTRVRNDRAVVGRARHWLPAGHPDREAYEEEMAAWADAENERLQREQEELEEEEEERKALEDAGEAGDEGVQDEVAVVDVDMAAEELPDEEMDWEANPELLVDLGEQVADPQASEDESGTGDQAWDETAPVVKDQSTRRSEREAAVSAVARWRTDNEADEVDELESDQGGEPAEEFADSISVVSTISNLQFADPPRPTVI